MFKFANRKQSLVEFPRGFRITRQIRVYPVQDVKNNIYTVRILINHVVFFHIFFFFTRRKKYSNNKKLQIGESIIRSVTIRVGELRKKKPDYRVFVQSR